MSLRTIAARSALLAAGLAAAALLAAGPAWAGSPLRLCLPKREGAVVLTPKHGRCKRGYRLTGAGSEGKAGPEGRAGVEGRTGAEGKQGGEGKAGLSSAQTEQLKALLPYVKFLPSGVGGKPTVQFSGVNIQLVNGEGKTASTNGEGNLVIGYDEDLGGQRGGPGLQTGSHNLILGEEQEFTSFGGIDAGSLNTIGAQFASVTGGFGNVADSESSSISGGARNLASGPFASISGGGAATASNRFATVAGGFENAATGEFATVGAGRANTAKGEFAAVSGGDENVAEGKFSSTLGGHVITLSEEFKTWPLAP